MNKLTSDEFKTACSALMSQILAALQAKDAGYERKAENSSTGLSPRAWIQRQRVKLGLSTSNTYHSGPTLNGLRVSCEYPYAFKMRNFSVTFKLELGKPIPVTQIDKIHAAVLKAQGAYDTAAQQKASVESCAIACGERAKASADAVGIPLEVREPNFKGEVFADLGTVRIRNFQAKCHPDGSCSVELHFACNPDDMGAVLKLVQGLHEIAARKGG